jgi:geranyl-CoA carboxylase beta subunit
LNKAAEAKPKFDKRGQLLPANESAAGPRRALPRTGEPGRLQTARRQGRQLGRWRPDRRHRLRVRRTRSGGGEQQRDQGRDHFPQRFEKSLRLQQIAMENKLPVITLAESGGANLNYAADIFVEGARSFANQARMSAMGLPQITVVHGSATAGGAYQPGLSDYVVVVRGKAKLFSPGRRCSRRRR